MTNDNLAALRKSLDDIDAVLVSALGERARLARQIATVKAEGDGPVRDADRETALLQHRSAFGERLGLDPAFVRRILPATILNSYSRHSSAPLYRGVRREGVRRISFGSAKSLLRI